MIAVRIREKQSSLSPNFDCILDLPVFRHGGYWYPAFHFEIIKCRAGTFVLPIWIVLIDGEGSRSLVLKTVDSVNIIYKRVGCLFPGERKTRYDDIGWPDVVARFDKQTLTLF